MITFAPGSVHIVTDEGGFWTTLESQNKNMETDDPELWVQGSKIDAQLTSLFSACS